MKNKLIITPIITLFLLGSFLILNSFSSIKNNEITTELVLDSNTKINVIIDNQDLDKRFTFIRTLKVKYSDFNKNEKSRINDTTFYHCAYNSGLILYSKQDSLSLESVGRKSCDIIAFFNLNTNDLFWLKNNEVRRIKILNNNTGYSIMFYNPEIYFFKNLVLNYSN